MENQKSPINYIYYINLKPELDNFYLQLSNYLSQLNIYLVPILINDLNTLDRSSKNHLIFNRNDLNSGMIFNQMRKTHFDMAMLSGKLFLYDISSFSEIDSVQKFHNKDCYKFMPLPCNIKQISFDIAVTFYEDKNKREEWPGGKRAKLPSMNTQN